MLSVAALGTAFYMSRLYFLVFSGESRASDEIQHHIHESPGSMVGPLVVLAIGAALGGFVGLPGGLFDHPELEPARPTSSRRCSARRWRSRTSPRWAFMVVATALALVGIGLAWLFYGGGYREPARKFAAAFPELVKLVQDKFRIDELYAVPVHPPDQADRAGDLLRRRPHPHRQDPGRGRRRRRRRVRARSRAACRSGDGQRYMAVFAIGVAGLVYFATRPTAP